MYIGAGITGPPAGQGKLVGLWDTGSIELSKK